jgi:hypothetical protein
MLKHHADMGADLRQFAIAHDDATCGDADLLAVEIDLAGVGPFEPVDTAQQCRLARAGRAEHTHGLALLHLKADITKHFEIAEALGYADYVENLGGVSHCDSWWSDSNIRIPSQRPLLRMLESKDH